MLMIVGPAWTLSDDSSPLRRLPRFFRFCGSTSDRSSSFGTAAGRLRGASAGGTHGLSLPSLRSSVFAAGATVAGSSAGTHGAGGELVRSTFATARPGAAFDAGTSGGTHGA